MTTVRLQSANREEIITVTGNAAAWQIQRADSVLDLILTWHSTTAGTARNTANGSMHPFVVWWDGNRVSLWLAGQVYVFTLPATTAQRATHAAAGMAETRLIAPMPGTIRDVRVTPGQTVTPGLTLVVMESMKMEMSLNAAIHGTVKVIHAVTGQLVEMQQLLVELEPILEADA